MIREKILNVTSIKNYFEVRDGRSNIVATYARKGGWLTCTGGRDCIDHRVLVLRMIGVEPLIPQRQTA